MRLIVDPVAAEELERQLDYLVDRSAVAAAARLEARFSSFLEQFLSAHPRSGKFVAEAGIWETWVPGTRLVIWYRFTSDELQVLRIWHSAQDRAR